MKRNEQLKALILLLSIYLFNLTILFAQNNPGAFFQYTGADQIFTVQPDVSQILVKVWGAGKAGGKYVLNDIGGGGGDYLFVELANNVVVTAATNIFQNNNDAVKVCGKNV